MAGVSMLSSTTQGGTTVSILSDKVAIITGASSGIGRATAVLFAREGARVVAAARRQPELDRLVEEIVQAGGEATAVAGDVSSEEDVVAIVRCAISTYGRLDIAFNNAGMLGGATSVTQLTAVEWSRIMDTNLTSGFLCAKHQLPELLKTRGSMIFTSSFVGYTIGMPRMPAYAASKSGVIGLAKALAAEYGPQGVRINALLPGGTDTPMARAFGDSPEVVEFVNAMHALKRQAQPEEIAHSALYLASDMSSFVTGTAMLVDGGLSMSKT